MATYYFDANGATSGFGTLTGNWNPSTALWSTSSAGTAATAAVTFTNADVAQFGFAGTTGTAGTATITTGITNTVNQVVTANLAGAQTIAGPGTLDLAGTTPTINVGSAGGLTISAPITGSSGFTKAGSGTMNVSGSLAGLAGKVTLGLGAGNLFITTNAANYNGGLEIESLGNNLSTNLITLYPTLTGSSFSLPAGFKLSGTGLIVVSTQNFSAQASGSGMSFPEGALATLTGTGASTSAGPTTGLGVYTFAGSVLTQNGIFTIKDLPSVLSGFFSTAASVNTHTQEFIYTASGASHTYGTRLDFITGGTSTPSLTFGLYANQASGPLVLSGGGTRYSTAAGQTVTLNLRGTSTADNTLSGPIAQTSGVLAISKADAGKWILSGANTYTGTTSVSAGTLSARSSAAFGAAASAVTQTGGTIEVTGGTALNKAGAALTLISAAGANALTSLTGSNTIACAGVTLSSTIIVDIASGADLTVNNTAAMSGAFGITKNNSGEFSLGTFANTYTGTVTVAAGTLTVGNLQTIGTASSLGTGSITPAVALTGTLKYNGTGHSTNRSITFTGSAPALDASGSGAVTFSACTQASGARTITFTGSNTAANTLSAALSDGTGAVSISKSGAGKWVLSNATINYTGTTTVSDGTLSFGGTWNRTLSGAVSVSGGTIENGTATVSANVTMTGGAITAELTGNKTLNVNSGSAATLQPTNDANSFSGATTVAAGGILRLVTAANPTTAGAGKVLGTSNVSVSGDIKTSAAGLQRGQMRYGGNLTFNSGAKLYVGLA